jgi:hypothetical protein
VPAKEIDPPQVKQAVERYLPAPDAIHIFPEIFVITM